MSKQTPAPDGVVPPNAPYSPVVVDGDLVLTAGQVAFDERGELVAGGVDAQVRRALENLSACLRVAGCGLEDVLKVTAFLADLEDFPGYNEVYREFFAAPYPARTTVGASLPSGILVEIEAIARRPG